MIDIEKFILDIHNKGLVKVQKETFDNLLEEYKNDISIDKDEDFEYYYLFDDYVNNTFDFYIETNFNKICLKLTMHQFDLRNNNKEIEDASFFEYFVKIYDLSYEQEFSIKSAKEKRDININLLSRANNIKEDELIGAGTGETYDEIMESLYIQHKESVVKRKRL